ncbi:MULTISPECIES: hypothetical protein [unclassified Sphingomonas]|nr:MULTISPECIES: hypothetical protein [unclassified Sphingomonas]
MTKQRKLPGIKPTHRIYLVTGEGKSAFWTPIGAAWPNRDGEGFSLQYDALPLGGRTVMRRITERPAKEAEAA